MAWEMSAYDGCTLCRALLENRSRMGLGQFLRDKLQKGDDFDMELGIGIEKALDSMSPSEFGLELRIYHQGTNAGHWLGVGWSSASFRHIPTCKNLQRN
jgi:hypothetical protein